MLKRLNVKWIQKKVSSGKELEEYGFEQVFVATGSIQDKIKAEKVPVVEASALKSCLGIKDAFYILAYKDTPQAALITAGAATYFFIPVFFNLTDDLRVCNKTPSYGYNWKS